MEETTNQTAAAEQTGTATTQPQTIEAQIAALQTQVSTLQGQVTELQAKVEAIPQADLQALAGKLESYGIR